MPIQLSLAGMTSVEVHQAIHDLPVAADDQELTRAAITGLSGGDSALMRIDHLVRLDVEGSLGDYAFAHHAQATVRLNGNAGHGVGEGMRSGILRIDGDAGVGAGTSMTGGTLAIYGAAGDRCGAAMRGGEIFVRGVVGDHAGVGALGGTIVIGGNAGHSLGNSTSDVSIFIRGVAASLADGVVEAPLRKREQLRLGLLLINASVRGNADDFRRIIPIGKLKAEQAQQGEIVPNWR